MDDRDPVPELTRSLFGKLFDDRGYLSQPFSEQLREQGVQLVTKVRKNMKNKLLPLFDKLLLCKRSIIETVNDPLKNSSQIEHSRHRSPVNFFVNLIAGLVVYTFREKKPSLNIRLPQALPIVM
ncbi:transposase [Nitrosomonas sp. Nm34]|uniref:transposase n=1 Tax=Nitrosomonas sp. Nm34 TaxID=1881055 RepID=UPI000B1E1EE9|nr:transposase [Nitrosomonas sp. Nm34]